MPVVKGIDYYGVLGLTRESEINDIKHAFRRLAVQYSTKWQKDPQVSKIFALAGESYEVLTSNRLRAIYDKYGEGALKKGVQTPQGWHSPYIYHGDPIKTYRSFFGMKNPYADLLDEMKSKKDIVISSDGKGPRKKQDSVVKALPLSLEEVYNGTLKKMKIVRKVFNDDNGGSIQLKERILVIEIKKGIPPGTEIVFEGVGDSGPLIQPGDVKYITEDKPHPVYERDGLNLTIKKEVSLIDALGGMTIILTSLDGRSYKIRITEVIRPGYVKVIQGEGMPKCTEPDTYGDLLINFNVHFPLYIPDMCKALISKCLNEADEMAAANKKDGFGDSDKVVTCKPTTEMYQLY